MAERWRKELRKLGSLDLPPDLWERIQGRRGERPVPDGRGPVRHRILAAAVALGLFAPVAYGAWRLLQARQRLEPAGGVSGVVEVRCREDAPRLGSPRVRLRPDGVHFLVENPVGADLLYVRDARDVGLSWGSELGDGGTEVLPIPPGEVLVGCFSGPFSTKDVPEEQYARLTVVDPDNAWPLLQEAHECGEPPPALAPGVGVSRPLAGALQGQILFMVFSEHNGGDIYRMNADGTEVTPILVGPTDDYHARWSPDGRQIAFVRAVFNESQDIFLMNADGSGVTQLTHTPAQEDQPVWSADGTRILFTSNQDGPVNLYSMGSDGTGVRKVTAGQGVDQSPAWSPDGIRLALVSHRAETDRSCTDLELFVMEEGQPVRQLTDDEAYEQSPAWSPDGTRIAFMWSNRSDQRWDLAVVALDGGEPARLTDHPGRDSAPVWSPDGRLIAFSSDRPQPGEDEESRLPVGIFVMNADGSGATMLYRPEVGNAFVEDWR